MTTTEAMKTLVPVDEPDPLWEFDEWATGRRMHKKWREIFFAGYETDDTYEKCNARSNYQSENLTGESGVWGCTRPTHPSHWKHFATRGYRGDIEAVASWGGVDPAKLVMEEVEMDDDPGEFELGIGTIYKFRNRPTMLMFIGKRKGEKVEVLDLTHQRYRVIDRAQLIPRKPDSVAITPEQIQWVATFMAERRDKVRSTALKQKKDGYYKSKADLDGVLVELQMEPTVIALSGQFMPQFTITAAGVKNAEAAMDLLMEWTKNLPPLPAGLKMVSTPAAKRHLNADLRENTV